VTEAVLRSIELARAREGKNRTSYLLHVSAYPIPQSELAAAARFLAALTSEVQAAHAAAIEVFVVSVRLDGSDALDRLRQHMSRWRPSRGLGIWPAREPPRPRDASDFDDLKPGGRLREYKHDVLRVTASEERVRARGVMLGTGGVVEVVTADAGDTYISRASQLVAPLLQHEIFLGYPFYLPLLDWSALSSADAATLSSWLCGAALYVRESIEDKGIVIASQQPLDEMFARCGVQRARGSDDVWHIPLPED
jgi:hypothetical protein